MAISRRDFFAGGLALPAFSAEKPAERPNLVLIAADGLPAWALGCYGNREFRTPQIDRLAQMGTRFSHHYAASPDPDVNRQVLLTGRTPMQLGTPADGLDKLLTAAGYNASVTGAADAAQFLSRAAPGKPFFLTVNLAPLRPPYAGASQKFTDIYAETRFDTVNPEGPN